MTFTRRGQGSGPAFPFPPQIIKAMKLTAAFLLFGLLHVSASTNAQQVSYSVKQGDLKNAFAALKQQTGVVFFYSPEDIAKAKPVTVEIKNTDLKKALDILLKEQLFDYAMEGNTVFIRVKGGGKKALANISGVGSGDEASPPTKDISGKVTDEDGNPLEGASVKVKGSTNGTRANTEGFFILKGVDEFATIEISYVGYETLQLRVNDRSSFAVSLKPKEGMLQEVIVNKGYYSEKQKYSVSDVGRVTSKVLEVQPVNNALLALQGRIPGLFIRPGSGVPGASMNVQVQGLNSLANGNIPFYVVDGVPYIPQMLSTFRIGSNEQILGGFNGSMGVNSVGNPLSFLNPNDIESIEVLKDADATAIYGSRASNGAILITTKKGKQGTPKFSIGFQTGAGQAASKLSMLNTPEYLTMRKEALANDLDVAMPQRDFDIMGLYGWDTTRTMDWQDELIGRTARFTNINASVAGGNETVRYLVSGNYQRETSVFPGDNANRKAGIHLNLSTQSANKKFTLQFSANYMNDNNQLPRRDLTGLALSLPPTAPYLFNSDGSLNWGLNSDGSSTWDNPLSMDVANYESSSDNLISNCLLQYKIIQGLSIQSSFGYSSLLTNNFMPYPLESFAPQDRPFAFRFADYSTNAIKSWVIEPQVNYERSFKRMKIALLAGATFQRTTGDGISLYGEGFSNTAAMKDIRSAPTVVVTNTVSSIYKYGAAFFRANVNFDDRWVLNLTARRDGSSRFGEKNLFSNFGSVGAAWLFGNEEWVKKAIPILSFGKIRLNYGTTGNDQIGDYKYLNLYSVVSIPSLVPYQGQLGTAPQGLPNPYLEWEKTAKLQGGLDLGLFNERVSLSLTYVRNTSSNQLVSYVLPVQSGFSSVTANMPAVIRNTALEMSLNAVIVKTGNLNWRTGINITLPKNKLVSFENFATSAYARLYELGKSINIQKLFKFHSVDPTTGVYQFVTRSGNITSTPDNVNDRIVTVDMLPQFYGGMQSQLSYKSFEFDIFFHFVKEVKADVYRGIPGGTPGTRRLNEPVTVLERWRNPGDQSSIQRFNTGMSPNYPSLIEPFSNMQVSDATYRNTFYARLKNVSLAYNFPQSSLERMKLSSFKIFIHAQNLLTFSNFKGLDPETGNDFLPPLRMVTVGAQIGL